MGTLKPNASASSEKPIISRKPRHSTTTVGWALTKRVSGLDASSMMPIAMTTAIIMMARWSTMPTAVMTESSENTASSTTICVTITQKLAYTRGPEEPPCWLPSRRSCSSMVPLNSRNRPPIIRIRSRPENDSGPMENRGAVSVTSHDMTDNRPRRMMSARLRPMMRARSRCAGGSLSARMAMKIRLSIPRTISRTTRVSKPTHAVGSSSHSIRSSRSYTTGNRTWKIRDTPVTRPLRTPETQAV
ncbi:hypothetical protein D9M68_561200 [compost metagenome]